jgi:hypothetical protein
VKPRVYIDTPNPGQWAFGVVSWPGAQGDGYARQVFIVFFRRTLVIEWGWR